MARKSRKAKKPKKPSGSITGISEEVVNSEELNEFLGATATVVRYLETEGWNVAKTAQWLRFLVGDVVEARQSALAQEARLREQGYVPDGQVYSGYGTVLRTWVLKEKDCDQEEDVT